MIFYYSEISFQLWQYHHCNSIILKFHSNEICIFIVDDHSCILEMVYCDITIYMYFIVQVECCTPAGCGPKSVTVNATADGNILRLQFNNFSSASLPIIM